MELTKKLRDNHEFLKSKCDNFDIKEVSGADLYYSDGAVQGADFKVEFSLKGTNYMRHLYVWPCGKWLCMSNNEQVKTLITEWIEQVKMTIQDDTSACK
jgi:hypothetical protein